MPEPGRTQAERTAATRARLIDAAIDSLVEVGWAGTTAVEVCQRAGVTRGALMHHFPGLPALLAAALGALYDEIAATGPTDIATLEDVIDATWARIETPKFKAVLEAWMATANNTALRNELGPVILGFAKLVSPDELPVASLLADDESRTFYFLARETMLGLALGRATAPSGTVAHETVVLDLLRQQARALDHR